jgi:APA family basic amino acid/polyamine antiporter
MDNQSENQERNLKQVLGTWDVIMMAVGLIIGAGVMSLTGVAIGNTGTGVIFAYLLSALLMVINTLPIGQMGAAAPGAGASYKYVSRLLGARWGFFFIALYIPTFVAISLYALSFGQYFVVLVPGMSPYTVAMILMTVFYILNLVGTKTLSVVQNLMAFFLLLALVLFIAFGLGKVDYDAVFTMENIFPNGANGFISATAILSFAMVGAGYIADLGGEMKKPSRDIPLGIISSTVGVGILYAFIAVVAAGVLPWKDIANQSLSMVAQSILPGPIFYFFIIGGALGAIATTLNGTLAYVTKPLIIASQDGYFPRKLGVVNKRTGTPIYLLTLFYIVAMIPLMMGYSMEIISNFCTALGSFTFSLPSLSLFFFYTKYPNLYEKSVFKLPRKLIRPISIIAVCFGLFQGFVLMSNFRVVVLVIILLYFVCAFIAGIILEKKRPALSGLE